MEHKVKTVCRDIEFGSYENTTLLPRPVHMYPTERPDWVILDNCMVPEILGLWRLGIWTLECCCGHGKIKGYVAVKPEHHDQMTSMGYVEDDRVESGIGIYFCKTVCETRSDVRQNWKLLPVKLTQEMYKAGEKEIMNGNMFDVAYEAAIAVAPGETNRDAL